jgi:hypothetical protein
VLSCAFVVCHTARLVTGVRAPARLCDFFDVVVFDLDNTLVPVHNPIAAASKRFVADVKERMPLSAGDILSKLREQMAM